MALPGLTQVDHIDSYPGGKAFDRQRASGGSAA
jgi:hypothetical protein